LIKEAKRFQKNKFLSFSLIDNSYGNKNYHTHTHTRARARARVYFIILKVFFIHIALNIINPLTIKH